MKTIGNDGTFFAVLWNLNDLLRFRESFFPHSDSGSNSGSGSRQYLARKKNLVFSKSEAALASHF
jgi:hypothetical protein